MRWPIIRLIWHRELRDQIRDRRTVFMLVVLPFLLYPALGLLATQFVPPALDSRAIRVAVQGLEQLPRGPVHDLAAVATAVGTLFPSGTGSGLTGPGPTAVTAGLLEDGVVPDDPSLIIGTPDHGWRFASLSGSLPALEVVPVPAGSSGTDLLAQKGADILLTVCAEFSEHLREGRRPSLQITTLDQSAASARAVRQLQTTLFAWKKQIKETRLSRQGLPPDFDDPFQLVDGVPDVSVGGAVDRMSEPGLRGLQDQLIRLVPFILVVWALAGALYPAVDVCAGEKERGTMETLLISPASREEIVLGKFLTIWVFSAATTLWNLACMGLSAWAVGSGLPRAIMPLSGVLWCVLSALPLTAFFSAVCLAMGVYARSTKEGQYYLMPLFLITMPLILLTLAPGVELNAFYSLVPITGVALLMQRLIGGPAYGTVPWVYAIPVLAAVVLYSGLALRWAVEQFRREEVLFREAERLDIALWLRRLFREKEARTSVGQGLFCFATLLVLRWSLFGVHGPLLAMAAPAVASLTLLVPPLCMALLLTRRPARTLGLRAPTARGLREALVLALWLVPGVAVLVEGIHQFFPSVYQLLIGPGLSAHSAAGVPRTWALQAFAASIILLAIGEELAFRGQILSGFRGRFGPRPAVVLTACLYGLYFMNAFWFLPAFAVGIALGYLRLATGTTLPGMVVHVQCRAALVYVLLTRAAHFGRNGDPWAVSLLVGGIACIVGLIWIILRLGRMVAAIPERRIEPPPEE